MEKENFCAEKERKKETAKEEEENTFGKEKCCPGNEWTNSPCLQTKNGTVKKVPQCVVILTKNFGARNLENVRDTFIKIV